MIIGLKSGDIEVYPLFASREIRLTTTTGGRPESHSYYLSVADALELAVVLIQSAKRLQ